MEQENPTTKNNPEKTPQPTKTTTRVGKYFIIGLLLTIFNYGFYTILSNLIINNNNFLWLSSLISTTATTVLAYILHSKITWKERPITKIAKYKFFIWNLLTAFMIGPILTQLFSLITPLYSFAHNISISLDLNLTYEFIQSTGAFIFTAIITMILNFLFYDKFVFGNKNNPNMIK